MDRSRISLALRVLSAICERRPVEPADAEELRELAESDYERSLPLDELACEVVMRERRRVEQAGRDGAATPPGEALAKAAGSGSGD